VRDGGPVEGLKVEVLFSEPFMAVLPKNHALARRKTISAADLRDEPFVFFPAVAGALAYRKPVSLTTRTMMMTLNWTSYHKR